MVYRDMAMFAKSLKLQYEAIELFTESKSDFNLAIAYQCLNFIFAETGNTKKAIESIKTAICYAQKCNHTGGLITFPIYRINSMEIGKKTTKSTTEHQEAISKFLTSNVYDPFCFEFIGRFFRLTGSYKKAKEILTKGLSASSDNPVAKAAIHHELSRLAQLNNSPTLEKKHRNAGNNIYKTSGLLERVINIPIPEYGTIYK